MRAALQDLRLTELAVVHAGSRSYALGRKIRAVALSRLLEDVPTLR
jgi:hypothetical protein